MDGDSIDLKSADHYQPVKTPPYLLEIPFLPFPNVHLALRAAPRLMRGSLYFAALS